MKAANLLANDVYLLLFISNAENTAKFVFKITVTYDINLYQD